VTFLPLVYVETLGLPACLLIPSEARDSLCVARGLHFLLLSAIAVNKVTAARLLAGAAISAADGLGTNSGPLATPNTATTTSQAGTLKRQRAKARIRAEISVGHQAETQDDGLVQSPPCGVASQNGVVSQGGVVSQDELSEPVVPDGVVSQDEARDGAVSHEPVPQDEPPAGAVSHERVPQDELSEAIVPQVGMYAAICARRPAEAQDACLAYSIRAE